MTLVSMAELTTARGHIHGANRHEEIPFPPRLDDEITDDHPGDLLQRSLDGDLYR
jgi:hypothetical protein